MDKTAEKILDAFSSIDEMVFCLLLLSLPLGWSISIVPLLAFLALQFVSVLRKPSMPSKRKVLYFLPLPILFLWNSLSLFWSDNTMDGIAFLGKQMSIIIIPLLFLFSAGDTKLLRKGMAYFIVGALVASITMIFRAFALSITEVNGTVQFIPSFELLDSGVLDCDIENNYFFGTKFSFLAHPVYEGMMLFYALIMLTYLQFKEHNIDVKPIYMVASIFLLISTLILLSTNITLLLSAIYLLFWISISIKHFSQYREIRTISIVLGVLLMLALLFSPQARVHYSDIKPQSFELKKNASESGIEIIKNNVIKGVGVGDDFVEIYKQYIIKGYFKNRQLKLNAHNQYLQATIVSGLPALLITLWMLYSLFNLAWRRRHWVIFGFAFALSVGFFFESFLHRYWGIVFIAIMYSLLYFVGKDKVKGNVISIKTGKRERIEE